MLSNVLRASFRVRHVLALARPLAVNRSALVRISNRGYYPGSQLMEREEGDYYADPVAVAERVVRLIALHDNVRDPASIVLSAQFEELGLNPLDLQEIYLAAEREFDVEISEEDCESFATVNDLVEYLSKNFYTK